MAAVVLQGLSSVQFGSMKVILFSWLWLALLGAPASAQANRYTLTIFADSGSNGSLSQQASSGSNFGHVFVELADGSKQVYIGYYGQRTVPRKGQLRPDSDLFTNGYWDVESQPYQITREGYEAAHNIIDNWGTTVGKWEVWRNCGDFAEAMANAAGVSLPGLKKMAGLNTPQLWAQYLLDHGGTVNPRRSLDGVWSFIPGSTSGVDQVRISQKGSLVKAFWMVGNRYFKPGSESARFILHGKTGTGVTHNAVIRNGAMIPFDIPARLRIKDLNTILLSGSGIGPDGKKSVIDTTLYRVQMPKQ